MLRDRCVFLQSPDGDGNCADSWRVRREFEVSPDTISSLELAYNKYEDLGREEEIISRNIILIKHPGFLPGGETLEILNE